MARRGSFRTQFEFKSVVQIEQLMSGMDLTDRSKVLSDAMAVAAKPIVEQSKANIMSAGASKPFGGKPAGQALYRTGALYKSMGFVVRWYRNRGRLVAYIGARNIAYSGNVEKKKASPMKDATSMPEGNIKVVPSRYIHLVHEGFFNKLTGKKVDGKPFLRDAFESKIAQAEWDLLSGCALALENVWKRNVAKVNRAMFKKSA